jgi:hypothetical protein
MPSCVGDLLIAVALHDQRQHFRSRALKPAGRRWIPARRQRPAADIFARMHGVDGADQLVVQHVFGQIRASARLQRAPDVFVAAVGAQRDNVRLRKLSPDGLMASTPLISGMRTSIR